MYVFVNMCVYCVPTTVTAKLCALSCARSLVDVNMNVVIYIRFYTYR